MKFASLVTLAALAVVQVSASPAEDVLPSGVPGSSVLPLSILSFDTTASASIVSALSSLISSESTAITPFLPTGTPTATQTSSPTNVVTTSSSLSSPTSTGKNGAYHWRDAQSAVVAGTVVGAMAAFGALL